MNRRNFTLAGFIGGIGAFIGKALGYDGTPKSDRIVIDDPGYQGPPVKPISAYSIKVGRKIMQVSSSGDGWNVFSAVASKQHQGDPLERYDEEGVPHFHMLPRLEQPPEDLKRWNADGDTMTLESTLIVYPRGPALQEILARLQSLAADEVKTKNDLQVALYYFAADMAREIRRQQNICDGHRGPAPLSRMTEMPDGRRLCGYCFKQESENAEQLSDGPGGQTPVS